MCGAFKGIGPFTPNTLRILKDEKNQLNIYVSKIMLSKVANPFFAW